MSDTFGTPSAKVSLFANVKTSEKQGDVTLDDIIMAIIHGDHRQVVESLRAAPSQEQADEIKRSRLPAFTPAGTFSRRAKADFLEPSGYFVLDFDKVENPVQLRNELALDPFVSIAFVSPSGNGVKALVRIEPVTSDDDIKKLFPHLSNYFAKKGNSVSADKSGKDISRLCLISYDPDLWQRDNPKIFRIADHPLDDVEILKQAVEVSVAKAVREGSDYPPNKPTTESNAAALEHLRNILRAGEKHKASGESRHEWMRSACTTGMRYVLSEHITEDEGLATIRDEYGRMFPGDKVRQDDVVRAWKGSRPIAEAKGALHPKPSNAGTTWNRSDTPDDVTPERIVELFNQAFTPNWSNRPPDVPDLITLGGHGIGRVGSVTMIMAGTKQGKSTVCGAIYARAINPNIDDLDSLGFDVKLPEDKRRVVYFDTEQSEDETWVSWERAIMRAGFKHGDELPAHVIENHICLTTISSHTDKQAMVLYVLENCEDVGLVVIDGIADLVSDVNEAKETNALMDRIRALATSQRVGVVITVHTNPTNDGKAQKPRGHLGSEALRRARAYIRVSKNSEKQIHKVTIEGNRGGLDNVETYFRYDEARRRHILCDKDDTPPESFGNIKLRNMMDEIMGDVHWKYNELCEAIAKRNGKSKGTAKTEIKKALAAGIIEKALGQYRIVCNSAREDAIVEPLF